ncbi:hypothetical protein C1646_739058 [Rhizophagus diaphanus]|nr:hypothetical protein C1646_739058 [Rhizophagus diaphanus] [Rhizophagus sp. MUCL 43196]
MTAESPKYIFVTDNIAKDEELLRHLHILDTLAYESLTAQVKYFKEKIQNQDPSNILHLKRIATKKYMCFFEVKKSLLKSSDFIDIIKFEISNKNEVFNLIIYSNITHFFNLLFTNLDPTLPDLQKVDIKTFFNYIVPPTLMKHGKVWDLYLNFRVQLYISRINKNPQKNLFINMFPKIVDGPSNYKENYIKVRNIIKRSPEDADKLMKEFKWRKFVEEMFEYISILFNELGKPLLHEYTSKTSNTSITSIKASPISSTRSPRVVIFNDASKKVGDSNAKKRRIADDEYDDDISSDNLDDYSSASKRRNISHH